MPFDYSQTADPRDFSELIPHNTIATVQMRIRPGNVGEGGLLKRTEKGDAEMLDCEFVILDGPHVKRKFWDNFLLEGTTPGQQDMAKTNRGRLKNILESARGIKQGDTSERARAAYQAELKDFNNIVFIAKIGISKGGPKKDGSGNWADKNYLIAAIKPEQKDWHPVEQPPPFNGGGGTAAPTGSAPADSASTSSTPIPPPAWAR